MPFLTFRKYIFFVLLLILTFSSKAQKSNFSKAYNAILSLNFDTANVLLEADSLAGKNNLEALYLMNYQFFLKAYFLAKVSDYENFIKYSEDFISLVEKRKESAYYNRMMCVVAIQESFIYFQWNHKFKTAQYLLKGRKYLNKAISLSPKDKENIKLQALFEVLLSAVPEKYKSIAAGWGFEGDADKGFLLIKKYLSFQLEPYQRTEGEIIQMFVLNFIGIENKFYLTKNFKNPLLSYLSLITLKKEIPAEGKITIIDSLLLRKNILSNYLLFLKAQLLIDLHKKEGVALMDIFIQKQKGVSFIKSAYFYKYWYYCAVQDSLKASETKAMLLAKGEAIFLRDQKMLHRVAQEACNSFLLSARLYFDAGAYKKSLKILLQPAAKESLSSLDMKIEFLYRLARVYEKTSRIAKAKELYKKIINTEKSELYFVAYSSFLLAKIYLQEGDKENAKKYFNRALDLNEGEYKTSIAQKTHYYLKKYFD